MIQMYEISARDLQQVDLKFARVLLINYVEEKIT